MSSSEIEQNIPTDFEKYKCARQKLAEEMMYRRERQWKVFSTSFDVVREARKTDWSVL